MYLKDKKLYLFPGNNWLMRSEFTKDDGYRQMSYEETLRINMGNISSLAEHERVRVRVFASH